MRNSIYIIGAGGHAKVVISTLISAGEAAESVYDEDASKHGSSVLGIPVVGGGEDFVKLPTPPAIIAVGSNPTREKIASRFKGVAAWVRAVHATAFVHESVEIGEGTVVFAGAVVQPDARIGMHCILNTGATVDHDCRIGDYVHLAPGVHLAGDVAVGDRSFLGIGSCVIQGIRIGRDAIVGAGAVVIRDVPDGATVIGVPARALERTD